MRTALVILASFFLTLQGLAAAQTTYCPETVSVDQNLAKIPPGWIVGRDDAPSALAGITFYSGPPEEKASLVYDKWTKRDGLAYGVWRFQPKSSQRIWLSCSYSSTRVVLMKQLPPETSGCTVVYDPKVQVSGSPEIQKITCQ